MTDNIQIQEIATSNWDIGPWDIPLEPMPIVIAANDAGLRKQIKGFLHYLGFDTIAAKDGPELIKSIKVTTDENQISPMFSATIIDSSLDGVPLESIVEGLSHLGCAERSIILSESIDEDKLHWAAEQRVAAIVEKPIFQNSIAMAVRQAVLERDLPRTLVLRPNGE